MYTKQAFAIKKKFLVSKCLKLKKKDYLLAYK